MRPKSREIVLLLLLPHRPWLCACVFTRLLIPVTFRLGRRLSRAGMRASAISSTDVLFADSIHWEKKGVFFGYFLCTSKESDPRYSIAEALALKLKNQKLDSSFRWNDERREKNCIPAFAAMTSGESGRHPHPNPLPPAGEGENQKPDSSHRHNGEQNPSKAPTSRPKPDQRTHHKILAN